MTKRLIEKSPIVIEQRDLDSTVMDDLVREPIIQVERVSPVINLQAQVSWRRTERTEFTRGGQGGPSQGGEGYLVFLKAKIVKQGVTLAQGDKITSIAGEPVNLYLNERELAGHRGGKPTLELWDFTNYDPTKPRP